MPLQYSCDWYIFVQNASSTSREDVYEAHSLFHDHEIVTVLKLCDFVMSEKIILNDSVSFLRAKNMVHV